MNHNIVKYITISYMNVCLYVSTSRSLTTVRVHIRIYDVPIFLVQP